MKPASESQLQCGASPLDGALTLTGAPRDSDVITVLLNALSGILINSGIIFNSHSFISFFHMLLRPSLSFPSPFNPFLVACVPSFFFLLSILNLFVPLLFFPPFSSSFFFLLSFFPLCPRLPLPFFLSYSYLFVYFTLVCCLILLNNFRNFILTFIIRLLPFFLDLCLAFVSSYYLYFIALHSFFTTFPISFFLSLFLYLFIFPPSCFPFFFFLFFAYLHVILLFCPFILMILCCILRCVKVCEFV